MSIGTELSFTELCYRNAIAMICFLCAFLALTNTHGVVGTRHGLCGHTNYMLESYV